MLLMLILLLLRNYQWQQWFIWYQENHLFEKIIFRIVLTHCCRLYNNNNNNNNHENNRYFILLTIGREIIKRIKCWQSPSLISEIRYVYSFQWITINKMVQYCWIGLCQTIVTISIHITVDTIRFVYRVTQTPKCTLVRSIRNRQKHACQNPCTKIPMFVDCVFVVNTNIKMAQEGKINHKNTLQNYKVGPAISITYW